MDRIGRFASLKEACTDFTPAFAPGDSDLTVAAQGLLLTTLEGCCADVDELVTDLKDLTDERVAAVKTLKEMTTRAVNRVKSNRAWATKLPMVKAAADKVRGMKLPKATLPTPPADPDAPAPKTRERGGQSYKDIEGHLGKLVAALGKCPDYNTGAPAEITTGMFETLQEAFRTGNASIAAKEVELGDAQIERLRLFESKKPLPDGSASLRDRWSRIKSAVKSQYGPGSAEYALVAPIKY